MRTVFTSAELAHIWANGRRNDARNSNRTMYVQNGAIYSYGSHFAIAAFVQNAKGETALLWNRAGYSSTTSQHKAHVSRALSRQQNADSIEVPTLNSDLLRDLPRLARECAKDAAEALEKSAKARQNRPYLIDHARTMLRTANRLAVFARGAKAEVFAELADDSKPAVAAYLKTVRGAEYRAQGAAKLADALSALRDAETHSAEYGANSWANARAIVDSCKTAEQRKDIAAGLYRSAGARMPANIGRITKRVAALRATYQPLADAEARAEHARVLADAAKDATETVALRQRAKRGGRTPDLNWYASRFLERIDIGRRLDVDLAPYAALERRVRAILVAESEASRLASARATRDSLVAYLAGQSEGYRSARSASVETFTLAHNRAEGAKLWDEVQALQSRVAEETKRRHAAAIEAWRNGERVTLPRDVPDMARIRGEIVETSRGASVPLDHAKRLVRIVRRVMREGGEQFAEGSGPMVGHYRVSQILFSGQTTIGCHTFEPEEAERAMAMIEAHQ